MNVSAHIDSHRFSGYPVLGGTGAMCSSESHGRFGGSPVNEFCFVRPG